MLMELAVPARSFFDPRGACLADRSPAHQPQEHRAGSESLFTCFWVLRGQTMRVAKKGKLPPGGPEGFRAREARGRCAYGSADPSSRGALAGRRAAGHQPQERTAPKAPISAKFRLFPPIVPTPDVLSQQKLRGFLDLTSSCIFSEKNKSRVGSRVPNPVRCVKEPIRRFGCIYLLVGTNIFKKPWK